MSRPSQRRFHSFLGSRLKAYLEWKQGLGYSSFSRYWLAWDLDYYLIWRDIASADSIDEAFIVQWIHANPKLAAVTKNHKLRFARGFLGYLVRLGLLRRNPALAISSLKFSYRKPYIYTLQEIQRILEEARSYKSLYPKRLVGWSLETMIFLIYACGLRLSEALNLKIEDVDFEENTLSLWKTKFHKERLAPFSPEAARRLKSYLARRRQIYGPASGQDPFFRSARGQYTCNTLDWHFRNILVRLGMARPRGRGAPRIHDLRHSFAVHRLYKWYQEGHEILNKLPILSTYMGHTEIEHTQVYLRITESLLREGDRRFQAGFEGVTHKALHRALIRS